MDSLAQAAQAKRRQRVHGKVPSPRNNNEDLSAGPGDAAANVTPITTNATTKQRVPSTQATVTSRTLQPQTVTGNASSRTTHSGRPVPVATMESGDPVVLLDRSMEAGEDAATLLASLQKVRKGTVSFHHDTLVAPSVPITTAATPSRPSSRSTVPIHTTTLSSSSQHQQQQYQHQQRQDQQQQSIGHRDARVGELTGPSRSDARTETATTMTSTTSRATGTTTGAARMVVPSQSERATHSNDALQQRLSTLRVSGPSAATVVPPLPTVRAVKPPLPPPSSTALYVPETGMPPPSESSLLLGTSAAVATKQTNRSIIITTDSPFIHALSDHEAGLPVEAVYDAACFTNASSVMLQLHSHPTSCLAAQDTTRFEQGHDDEGVPATWNGKFLGQPNETLHISLVRPLPTTSSDKPQYLCFGDVVTLNWATRQNQSMHLGVQPKLIDEHNPHQKGREQPLVHDVGFYLPARGHRVKSQQWIVFALPTTSSSFIKVGHEALEEDAVNRVPLTAPHQDQSDTSSNAATRLPVRAGDPVVLRNCLTGGILSSYATVNGANAFVLLTDAHRQPLVAPPLMDDHYDEEVVHPHGEPSLITRLHRSDRLIPTANEVFAFWSSASPSLPLWNTPLNGRRIATMGVVDNDHCLSAFLDGSYIQRADRHEPSSGNKELDHTLFGDSHDHNETLIRSSLSPHGVDGLVDTHTLEGQEKLLLDEILGACLGYEGRFVKAVVDDEDRGNSLHCPVISKSARLRFVLLDEHQFDSIVLRLVRGMLMLPSYFARVRCFISLRTPGYEYGSVMQAFCVSLGQCLHKAVADVVTWQFQYRQGMLTLPKLQLLLRSTMATMSVLSRACLEIRSEKGGALINALLRIKVHSYEGDREAECILQSLLDDASVPFISRLMEWLEFGILADNDPHGEFMIQKNDSVTWEHRYTLSTENVLHVFFATETTVQHVLAAGRYWNALLLCDNEHSGNDESLSDFVHDQSEMGSRVDYSSSSANISILAQVKYREASRALTNMMFNDFRLLDSLRFMKRFFLMENGDFFLSFLDRVEDEMLEELPQLSRNRVQHWMNTCLHGMDQRSGDLETEGNGTHHNKGVWPLALQCRFADVGLADHLERLHQASGGMEIREPWTPIRHTYGATVGSKKGDLTGLDTFYLEVNSLPFPTSIVLSEKAIESYQLLFRHLFYAKFVERRLVSIWKDHQMLKELQALRGPMGATFLLLQRMLHFIQNLIYYCMFEVIEPLWFEMEKAMAPPKDDKDETIDDIMHIHSLFLQQALEACLLTNRDLVKALTKLLKTCLLFSEQMKRFMKATKVEEEQNAVAVAMQKEMRHNLNARGSQASKNGSSTRLRHSLQHAREERAKRIQRQSARVEREVCGEPYRRMVVRFEEVFSKNLRDFMAQLTSTNDAYHSHKANLCIRLDYNGYITRSLGLY